MYMYVHTQTQTQTHTHTHTHTSGPAPPPSRPHSQCHLKPPALIELGQGIRELFQLKSLDLSHNPALGGVGCEVVGRLIELIPTLEGLGLSHVDACEHGAAALMAKMSAHRVLKTVDLSFNRLGSCEMTNREVLPALEALFVNGVWCVVSGEWGVGSGAW